MPPINASFGMIKHVIDGKSVAFHTDRIDARRY